MGTDRREPAANRTGRAWSGFDRVREIRALYRISRLGTSTLRPEAVAAKGLRELCHALRFERGEIWLLGSEGKTVRLFCTFGQEYTCQPQRLDLRACPFTMRVLRRRQAIHHPDVTRGKFNPELWKPWVPVSSVFGSPLRTRGRLIGTVCADRGGRRFDMTALDLLFGSVLSDLLAEIIGQTLERHARARRLRRMTLLGMSGRVLSAEDNLPALARRITGLVCRRMGSHGCLLALLDGRGRRLEIVAAAGAGGMGLVGCRAVVCSGARGDPLALACATRRPAIVEDMENRPGTPAYWRSARSVLAVPVRCKDRVLGALALGAGAPDTFEQEDAETFAILGEQIGHAIVRMSEVKALHRRHADLSAVSADLDRLLEEDRRRIARELHDELAQSMTAAKINLGLLKDVTAGVSPAASRTLAETIALIDRAIAESRRISMDLRPSMLDDLGLLPALRWYASKFARRTGIRVSIDAAGGDRRLRRDLETLLYRFVQEGLTNVARHARARRVRVVVRFRDGTLRATVADDGAGMPAGGPLRGLGLLGMRERIERVSGCFRIVSRPGRGTRLTAEIPLRAARQRPAALTSVVGGAA